MKKVLILAYDFPPYNSIGAQRPYSWYRYFSKLDWYPVVICNASKDIQKDESYPIFDETIGKVKYVELKQINYKHVFVRKIYTLIKLIFGFYIKNIDNRKELYKEAHQYLLNEKVDLIIATGEPFILFTFAAQLSKEFSIPWVADYRDGWSTNYTALYKSSFITKLYYKYVETIERSILKKVSLITTTSSSQRNELMLIHKNKKVEIIYNGFFEEIIKKVQKQQNNKTFTIVYGGTIYKFQKLELFLSGFRRFIKDVSSDNIIIKFIGVDFFGNQIQRISNYDSSLNNYIQIMNRMPLEKALENMSEANILLLLGHESIKQLYAKVFDYVALNRKILFVVNDNSDVSKILTETDTGMICQNEEDVYNYLKSSYNEFIEKGFVYCKAEKLSNYTREYQASRMVELLNSILH